MTHSDNREGIVVLRKSDVNAMIDALEKEVSPTAFARLTPFLMPTLNVRIVDEHGKRHTSLCAVYVHRLNGLYSALASTVPLRTRRKLPRLRTIL